LLQKNTLIRQSFIVCHPWDKNKLWLELLAKSGTHLFISVQPQAIGTTQKVAIKKAVKPASMQLPGQHGLTECSMPFPKNKTQWLNIEL
jgi:hypothetical protein